MDTRAVDAMAKDSRAVDIRAAVSYHLINIYFYVHVNWSSDSFLIGSLFMSRVVKFFNFSYSLLDSTEDEIKLVVTVNKFRCSTSSSGLVN